MRKKEHFINPSHQRGIDERLRRSFRVVFDVNHKAEVYSVEERGKAYGLTASIGRVLQRAKMYTPPFLTAHDIRFFRFEDSELTDDPEEMQRRFARAHEFETRLRKLFGI